VGIGGQVPGEPTVVTISRLGEGLPYNGRFVAFWGSWGGGVREITLHCAADGQSALIAFCREKYPEGLVMKIPENQGFFVHDAQTRKTHPVVKTGGDYVDFLYWAFSGCPPGVGHGGGEGENQSEGFEEPRWRAGAFVAVHSQGAKAQVAFRGRRQNGADGIYLTVAPSSKPVINTVVETRMDATLIDAMAPAGSAVTTVGIERDGLRNGWLAISASMGDEEDGWAGVYVTRTKR